MKNKPVGEWYATESGASVRVLPREGGITEVVAFVPERSDAEERKRFARLIAASPKLLKTIKSIYLTLRPEDLDGIGQRLIADLAGLLQEIDGGGK